MSEQEPLEEADSKLYSRDLVIQDCNSYIKQYLEKNNLLRTCREFMRECKELEIPAPSLLNGKVENNVCCYNITNCQIISCIGFPPDKANVHKHKCCFSWKHCSI